MSGAPVVVLGDVMTDVVARIDGPLAHASDTPARIVMRPGGSAANTAAWLGRLGVPAVMAGCVGDDAPGREARASLEAEGVVAALAVAPGLATGACVVLVEPDGERTMLPDAGANAALPVAPLPACAHLHVSGYALIREGSRGSARAALAAAAATGATTSVNPASAAPLAALGAAALRALVAGVGTVLATLDEAEVLTGTRDPEAAAAALLAGHPEVVLKLGAQGALWRAADGSRAHAPAAAPAGPVVDTTGAGDAFTAAWLAARRAGRAPAAALAAACALAADAVTRPGARPPR